MTCSIVQSDALDFLRHLPEGSVQLVLGSPPYMDARTYDDGTLPEEAVTVRDCHAWVDWMLDISEAAVRASAGLVLWVVAGVQRDNCYWPGCEGLAWEWWKRGNQLWAPCVWWKVDSGDGGTGIPGSGGNVPGKRWLRKDWEYVLCFKRADNIPYDHPENMGTEPVYATVGGAMSNRTADGRRINARVGSGFGGRRQNGEKKSRKHKNDQMPAPSARGPDGEPRVTGRRPMPKIVNPGNVIPLIVKARVGGGHMGGDAFCSLNEAPYPEALAEFFVLCYSAPGALVCDPFSGSGTTAAVSVRHGRNFTGCDLRSSQVKLALRRVSNETPLDLLSG